MAAHPSNKSFASGSHDKTIKLWDIGKVKETATLSDHKEGVWSLDYSASGKLLVSASPDKSVLIWDSNKSSAGQKLIGHKDKVYNAKFNQSNKLVASIGEGGQLLIWDIAKTDKPIKTVNLNATVGYNICWSGNEDILFVTTMGLRTIALDAKNFSVLSEDIALPDRPKSKMLCCAANWKTMPNKVFSSCVEGLIVESSLKDGKLKK